MKVERSAYLHVPIDLMYSVYIIFAVACLKAIREVPEAATPERIGGLRKMVQSFGKTKHAVEEDPEPLVGLDDERKFIHFIFEEFLKAKKSYWKDALPPLTIFRQARACCITSWPSGFTCGIGSRFWAPTNRF